MPNLAITSFASRLPKDRPRACSLTAVESPCQLVRGKSFDFAMNDNNIINSSPANEKMPPGIFLIKMSRGSKITANSGINIPIDMRAKNAIDFAKLDSTAPLQFGHTSIAAGVI